MGSLLWEMRGLCWPLLHHRTNRGSVCCGLFTSFYLKRVFPPSGCIWYSRMWCTREKYLKAVLCSSPICWLSACSLKCGGRCLSLEALTFILALSSFRNTAKLQPDIRVCLCFSVCHVFLSLSGKHWNSLWSAFQLLHIFKCHWWFYCYLTENLIK